MILLSKPLVKALNVVASILRVESVDALCLMTCVIRTSFLLKEWLIVPNITCIL